MLVHVSSLETFHKDSKVEATALLRISLKMLLMKPFFDANSRRWAYTHVSNPPSILSLSLQGSDVNIVFGIKQLLKASTTLASMAKQDPLQWPTVKTVLDRVKNDSGENVYQGVALKRYV